MNTHAAPALIAAACAAALCAAGSLPAAPITADVRPANLSPLPDYSGWVEAGRFLGRHVRLGTRWVRTDLTDDKRNVRDLNGNGKIDDFEVTTVSYLGSIVELQEIHDDWPDKIFVQWAFDDGWGLELSYERFQARTVTFWDGHTDGTFDLHGPMLSLYGAWPNRTPFTPRGGAGLVFLDTDFRYNPLWHDNGTYLQTLAADGTIGWAFFLGCEARLTDRLALDLFLRQMYADLDAHYYIGLVNGPVIDDRGWRRYPMDNKALGIGLRYAF